MSGEAHAGSTVKLVWLTDLHMVAEGDTCYDHDPTIRLKAAIELINAHHQDASFCILTGDLVNDGTQAVYHYLRELLAHMKIPYLALVGNHDDRELVQTYLNPPTRNTDGFIHYKVETDAGYIICLDTLKLQQSYGQLCADRLAWLKSQLDQSLDKPVYLFMHHHPVPIGLPMQDVERIENGEALLSLLSNYKNIGHIFFGHIHRLVSGNFGKVPFCALNSTTLEAPPPTPAWDWDTFTPAPEAPMMGIITLNDIGAITQYQQICDYRLGSPHL